MNGISTVEKKGKRTLVNFKYVHCKENRNRLMVHQI